MSGQGARPADRDESALGCDECLEGVYTATQPRFIAATSPADLLYRCAFCRTWWIGDGRSLHPVADAEAQRRFPGEVAP
jgi:hypothetical protein